MNASREIAAILLCAGRGSRFDPAGRQNKLMQPLDNGLLVAQQSARHLRAVLPDAVAVVRPGQPALAALLEAEGMRVVTCEGADEGMAASLREGLQASSAATGWVVALADMPFVQASTIRRLADAVAAGAAVAVPVRKGERGNPVGFSRDCLPQLLALRGDAGARSLLNAAGVRRIEVDDAGIHRDIDTPSDLER